MTEKGARVAAKKEQERVLAATIHVQTDDAAIVSAFGGLTESQAREAVGDAAVDSWGDHVWADDAENGK